MFFEVLSRHVPLPRSLRLQFILALGALEFSIVVGSLMAVYALRVSASAARNLVEERLVHMQDANDLAQRTLLIERDAERMRTADSVEQLRTSYDEAIRQMERLDALVERLGTSTSNVSVLALIQAGQIFRNTAHIIAGLRETELQAVGTANAPAEPGRPDSPHPPQPSLAGRAEALRHFDNELQNQTGTMVASARQLSDSFNSDYREAMGKLAASSIRNERWVVALFFGSLLVAWLVSRWFIDRQVLPRLQAVSDCLRQGGCSTERPRVPVQGHDEIGDMARAVEHFLEDRQHLAEANKDLEAFSYTVSHDLRAPLRAIDGFSRILQKDYPAQLGENGMAHLERIHKNAMRMHQLIEDILTFSRTSRREMAMHRVDMAAMVRDIFTEVRSAAPERNIILRLGELPPINGDSALIRQVLVNLLSNSVKFTATRTEAVIEVDCVDADGESAYRTYCVKDNGVGFEMQYADKLFGVFQRMDGSEKFEGTGIGLAIVKRVVVRHGGQVWAKSKPGEGTSIFFTLPGSPSTPQVESPELCEAGSL